jgi:putative tryptophan/tyrosine transport system substrate-binding protein
MKRRDAAVALLASAVAPGVWAQPAAKVRRVGFVATASPIAEISGPDPANPFARAFVHGLRDLGYVKGKNLVLEMRTLEGKPERFEGIVSELVRLNTEVVFLPTTPLAVRAQRLAPQMPIVALIIPSHLFGAGVAQSMGRPGGTITGLSIDVDERLEAKRLELLLEFAPRRSRIAYLGLRETWELPYVVRMRALAEQLGATVVLVETGQTDFTAAFARLRLEQVHAFMVERSPRAYARSAEIGQLARASGLPTSCQGSEHVEAGCLMAYGNDNVEWGRRISVYVDKILKGAKPGDLPIEAPTKFELVINAKTAKALGLAIPQSVILRADRVIE